MFSEHFSEHLIQLQAEVKSGKKVYGIFGSPISHSLSPLMQNKAFSFKKIDAVYLPFLVEISHLKSALDTVFQAGLVGLNITLPLKESVIHYLDDVSADARRIGSVNTIALKNGKRKGYNTDLEGFLAQLRTHIEPIQYENVTIFGSGGIARTVLYALLRNFSFPYLTLIILDREQGNKLLDTAETWKKGNTNLELVDYNDTEMYAEKIWESRLLINCTPLGMTGYPEEFPDHFARFFRPGQIAYDLIYTPLRTSFIKKAETRGAITLSGLDMLIGQGAQSFRIWTGKVMPKDTIKDLLVTKLSEKS